MWCCGCGLRRWLDSHTLSCRLRLHCKQQRKSKTEAADGADGAEEPKKVRGEFVWS